MNKIKIFLNPIEDREKYINKIAREGYRLIRSGSFLHTFEKTDLDYKYAVQYIGYMSNKERKEYLKFLNDMNLNVFSAPINIGKISLGNVRLRPYNLPEGMIATYPGMINKEILIIESDGAKDVPVFSDRESKTEDIRRRKAPYYYLLVVGIILECLGVYKSMDYKYMILGGILLLISVTSLYKFNSIND